MDLLTLLGSTFLLLEMELPRNVKENNFKCEICHKVFKTKNILKKHFSNVHDNKGKNLQYLYKKISNSNEIKHSCEESSWRPQKLQM